MKTTHELKEVMANGSDDLRFATAMFMWGTMVEWLPWMAARTFKGVSVLPRDGGWLMILKGEYRGKAQIAFAWSDELGTLLTEMAYAICWDLVNWQVDKLRTMRIDDSGKLS